MAKSPINDSRHRDAHHHRAEELAELLRNEEVLRAVRLAEQLLGFDLAGASPGSQQVPGTEEADTKQVPGTDSRATTPPRPISIWRPRRDADGWIFERPAVGPFGDHYASRRRWRQAKVEGTRRIVLLGESVAAGYLYAPHWTPAQALEARLRQGGDSEFEVVDLARTNERLASMAETLEASLQLQPDAVVIFAGNNWTLLETPEVSPYAPSPQHRQRVAETWRSGDSHLDGARALGRLARQRLRRQVLSTFADLAPRLGDLPIVWVLPESHLAGWQVLQPVHWLAGNGSQRWHGLLASACLLLKAQRYDAAVAALTAMAELDGGTCATTPRLLVHAWRGLGDHDKALAAARQHLDAAAYPHMACLGTPQAGVHVQRLIQDLAKIHGWEVVDLPSLFSQQTGDDLPEDGLPGDGLPGDELFADYCHLTAHGMDLAMTATARRVLRLLELEPDADWNPEPLAVEARVEATACIGAAVHGAHRHLSDAGNGRRDDTGIGAWPLDTWLRRAVEVVDGPDRRQVLDTLEDLLEVRSSSAPEVLTMAQGRQLQSAAPLQPQHGWRWPWLDVPLLDALCRVLEEHGRDPRPRLHRRLLRHHGVDAQGKDLSRPPFLWQPLARLFPDTMDDHGSRRRATVKSPWPHLDLCLISEPQTVELDLTARLPPIAGQPRHGDVTVAIDGQSLGLLPLRETWSRHRLRIPTEVLGNVIHRLRLSWPPLPKDGSAALEEALDRLALGREADLHPIFGEVHSLWAKRILKH